MSQAGKRVKGKVNGFFCQRWVEIEVNGLQGVAVDHRAPILPAVVDPSTGQPAGPPWTGGEAKKPPTLQSDGARGSTRGGSASTRFLTPRLCREENPLGTELQLARRSVGRYRA